MKFIFNLIAAIIFLFLSADAFAQGIASVNLSDGSVLTGKIVSVDNGVYIIKTESLGTIKINKSKISSINFGSLDNDSFSSSAGEKKLPKAEDIKDKTSSLSKILMGNKNIMSSIMSLQNDPGFKAVLNDPQILNAVNSGDINSLLSNPKIMELMNNPIVKDITKKLPAAR